MERDRRDTLTTRSEEGLPSHPVQPVPPPEGWRKVRVYAGRTANSLLSACQGGPAPYLGFGGERFSIDCVISRDLEPWPETDTKRVPFLTYIIYSIVYNRKKYIIYTIVCNRKNTSFMVLFIIGKNNLNVW